jgi:hypothetical protein
METLATVCFALAVLHTFAVKRFAHWAHQYPPGSVRENLLHFLAETEVVFGLWAAALFAGIAVLRGSVADAVAYIERLNFTEPKFVLVVLVVAAWPNPSFSSLRDCCPGRRAFPSTWRRWCLGRC